MICTRTLFCLTALVFASCSDDDVKEPVASFSHSSNNEYVAPSSISFKNESSDAKEYTWDFGDGLPVSNNINPIHVYVQAGTYTVTLIAANGDKFAQLTEEIVIHALPTADFSFSSDNDYKAMSPVKFENKSLNSVSYSWDFGDGETSTERDPDHTYDEAGTYTIQLTATNSKGNDVKTAEIIIQESESVQLNKLKGEWTLVTANDGQDRTSDFTGVVLQLEGNYSGEGKTYNYNLTGERPDPSPWPESGTWKFGNPKTSQIIRDPAGVNEITMTYSVTETNLTISFTVPDGSAGWPGGRVKNVIGDWEFIFAR